MDKRALFAAGLCFWALPLLTLGQTQIDWPIPALTKVASGVSRPTDIENAADGSGRLFVTEQSGRVLILQNGALLATPFLDLGYKVLPVGQEQGLLGLAFPPGFASKGYFYVYYTRASDQNNVVSRFFVSSNPNVATSASEQVILAVPQLFDNHNAGQIKFGPDGYLYIGKGDGGSEGDPDNLGQNTSTLLGKLLRIDVESGAVPYAVPPSNPFVGNSAYAPEIWALGLRNPWRFSFDRQTGDLYIADVGQNLWEEIDYQSAQSAGGQNYGWRIMEGDHPFIVPNGFNLSTLTDPVAEFPHSSATGAAIIGGFVYRGPSSPRMDGAYFCAFFPTYPPGNLWAMKYDGAAWQTQGIGSIQWSPSTFGEDEAGLLYVADYYDGVIYQLTDTLAAHAPTMTPPAATYNDAVTVTLASDSNSTIYYTTDGSTPTTASASLTSGGTVAVTTSLTLRAFAVKPGLTDSAISSAAYVLQAATPAIAPAAGLMTGPITASITTATPDATIYYTLDNTTPTTASPVYSVPIAVAPPATVSAIAIRTGFVNSIEANNSYLLSNLESASVAPLAGTGTFGFANGPGSLASFDSPRGLCVDDAGNLYVADTYNSAIRLITPAGQVSTFAGGKGYGGELDGPLATAQFESPTGICIDASGNLFITDNGSGAEAIREISTAGMVTTLGPHGSSAYSSVSSIAVDAADNLYISDDGAIRKLSAGVLSFLAFSYNSGGQYSIGIGLDPNQNLITSTTAERLNLISPSGAITAFAGSSQGYTDGPRALAEFANAAGVCVDAVGKIYVADGQYVRLIRPNGQVSTLASNFQRAYALCVDKAGAVYVIDFNTNSISKITPANIEPPPALATNIGLAIDHGSSAVITSANLAAQDANLPDSAITFTIPMAGAPANGTLTNTNSGAILTGGSAFTQADIDNGFILYTYTGGANPSDAFQFEFADANGIGLAAGNPVFTFEIALRQPPTALNGSYTTAIGAPVSGQLGVKSIGSTQFTWTITLPPAMGTLTAFDQNTGAFTYQPAPDSTGTVTFAFTVSDGVQTSLNPGTVSIKVAALSPVTQSQTYVTSENTPVSGQATATDPDLPPSPLVFSIPAGMGPTGGIATITDRGAGAFTYSPNSGFFGVDSFSISVSDLNGAPPALAKITVVVQTTLRPGLILVADQTGARIDLVDPTNGQAMVFASGGLLTSPSGVAIDLNGQVVVADNGSVGSGAGGAAIAPSLISINPATGAQTQLFSGGLLAAAGLPLASPLPQADGSLLIAAGANGLLKLAGTSLTQFSAIPEVAAIAAAPNGNLYAATAGAPIQQPPSSAFQVDPATGANTALTLTGSLLPTASGIGIELSGHLAIASPGSLASGTDALVDVDPIAGLATAILSGSPLEAPAGLTVRNDGQLFVGSSTGALIFQVDPGSGSATSIATAGVVQSAQGLWIVNPPVFSVIADQQTNENIPITGLAFTVTEQGLPSGALKLHAGSDNQTLVSDSNIVVTPIDGQHCTLAVTPSLNQHGSVHITLSAADGLGLVAQQFLLTVNLVNLPPVAVNDKASITSAAPVILPVLANDSDPNGYSLTVASVSRPFYGTAVISENGQTITYTPGALFAAHAQDSFEYTITDSHGAAAAATVTLLNPFYALKAAYSGPVTAAEGPAKVNVSGNLTLALTNTGAFTGTLSLAAARYAFSGTFGVSGSTTVTIKRAGQPSISLALTLDFADGDINATISEDAQSYAAEISSRVSYNGTTNPDPAHGAYTVLLNPPTAPTGSAALASATVTDGKVAAIALSSGGSGYVTPPRVSIAAPSGRGAKAAAVLSRGSVASLTMLAKGNGYPPTGTTITIDPPALGLPQGTGWATMNVSKAGAVTLAGRLGDGTPFSAGAFMHKTGANDSFTLNASIYSTPGSLIGNVVFENLAASDCDAAPAWYKPAQPVPGPYPSGFATNVSLQGSLYETLPLTQALDFTNTAAGAAAFTLTLGNLSAPISHLLSISDKNAVTVTDPSTDALKLTINPALGTFTGTFLPDPTQRAAATGLSGVLYQKTNLGAGVFLGPTQAGAVSLTPK